MPEEKEFPAQWAIDLLRGPTIYKENWYNTYAQELFGAIIGFSGVAYKNYWYNKPVYASIHHYPLVMAVTMTAGYVVRQLADLTYAKRDAMMVGYIQQYPERFPEENKKLSEVLEEWVPIR